LKLFLFLPSILSTPLIFLRFVVDISSLHLC